MIKALPRLRKGLGGNKTLLIPFGLATLTVFFRLNQLSQLPPGLHPREAELGLVAKNGKLFTTLGDIQSTLTVLVAKIGLALDSNRIFGLRLGFAVAGAVASAFVYLFIKRAFGRRTAIIATLMLATLPLALNLTRFGDGYALVLLFSAASLYYLTCFWQKPTAKSLVALVISLAGGMYSHPSFNWFVAGLAVVAILNLPAVRKFKAKRTVKGMISLLVYLLVAAPAAPAALKYFSEVPNGFGGSIGRFGILVRSIIVKTTAGGEFNLATQPLLNAFIGLMLVLGIMIAASSLKRFAHRVVFILFLTSLLPYLWMPDAPLGDRLVTLVIPAITLAAIGTDYLLGQWHKTFPINSAARQAGSLMLVVLLFFSSRYGYTQYFLAWRASTETKRAYTYQAVAAVNFADHEAFKGDRYLVGTEDELKVAEYLASSKLKFSTSDEIKKLPKLKGTRQFILLPKAKEDAFDNLAKKFPGGKLKSTSDDLKNELFLVYTVKP